MWLTLFPWENSSTIAFIHYSFALISSIHLTDMILIHHTNSLSSSRVLFFLVLASVATLVTLPALVSLNSKVSSYSLHQGVCLYLFPLAHFHLHDIFSGRMVYPFWDCLLTSRSPSFPPSPCHTLLFILVIISLTRLHLPPPPLRLTYFQSTTASTPALLVLLLVLSLVSVSKRSSCLSLVLTVRPLLLLPLKLNDWKRNLRRPRRVHTKLYSHR